MAYKDKLLAIESGHLVAYWPLNELDGVTIHDLSGHGFNGAAQGFEWGRMGINENEVAPYLDGLNDYGNVYGLPLRAAFPTTRGTLLMWHKVHDAGVWTDGIARYLARFVSSTGDNLTIAKGDLANRLDITAKLNGVSRQKNVTFSDPDSFMAALAWDADLNVSRFWLNGLPLLPDLASAPFTGNLTTAVIGALNVTPANVAHGDLSHFAIWNTMLTDAQVSELGETSMTVTGVYNHTRIDYDGEKSTHSITVPVITAANFDAQAALRAAYGVAIAGICNGVFNKYQHMNQDWLSDDPSASPLDQREIKWLVQYHDAVTTKKYRFELPCADLSVLDPNDRAHAEIGDAGVVDAFIDAFEAFALSEVGNAVVIDEITFVGRNI